MRASFSSLALAGVAVALVACDTSEITAPHEADVPAPVFAKAPAEQHVSGIPLGSLTGADIQGTAWLTRSKDGIWVEVEAWGSVIEAMDAATVWAVIFNNPQGCVDGCGGDDLGRPEAGAMVLNFGGGYDSGNGHFDNNELLGHLERHSTEGKQVLVPGPDAPPGKSSGVKNPFQVEVHVILRNHGIKEADSADRAAQTTQVGAFCNLLDQSRADTDGVIDGCSDQMVFIFVP